jgi:hypothetical protein
MWIFYEKPMSNSPDDLDDWLMGPIVYMLLCLSIITALWGV